MTLSTTGRTAAATSAAEQSRQKIFGVHSSSRLIKDIEGVAPKLGFAAQTPAPVTWEDGTTELLLWSIWADERPRLKRLHPPTTASGVENSDRGWIADDVKLTGQTDLVLGNPTDMPYTNIAVLPGRSKTEKQIVTAQSFHGRDGQSVLFAAFPMFPPGKATPVSGKTTLGPAIDPGAQVLLKGFRIRGQNFVLLFLMAPDGRSSLWIGNVEGDGSITTQHLAQFTEYGNGNTDPSDGSFGRIIGDQAFLARTPGSDESLTLVAVSSAGLWTMHFPWDQSASGQPARVDTAGTPVAVALDTTTDTATILSAYTLVDTLSMEGSTLYTGKLQVEAKPLADPGAAGSFVGHISETTAYELKSEATAEVSKLVPTLLFSNQTVSGQRLFSFGTSKPNLMLLRSDEEGATNALGSLAMPLTGQAFAFAEPKDDRVEVVYWGTDNSIARAWQSMRVQADGTAAMGPWQQDTIQIGGTTAKPRWAYETVITLKDDNDAPVPSGEVDLSATATIRCTVNGISTQLLPDTPVRVAANKTGKLIVHCFSDDLDTPALQVFADGGTPWTIVRNPAEISTLHALPDDKIAAVLPAEMKPQTTQISDALRQLAGGARYAGHQMHRRGAHGGSGESAPTPPDDFQIDFQMGDIFVGPVTLDVPATQSALPNVSFRSWGASFFDELELLGSEIEKGVSLAVQYTDAAVRLTIRLGEDVAHQVEHAIENAYDLAHDDLSYATQKLLQAVDADVLSLLDELGFAPSRYQVDVQDLQAQITEQISSALTSIGDKAKPYTTPGTDAYNRIKSYTSSTSFVDTLAHKIPDQFGALTLSQLSGGNVPGTGLSAFSENFASIGWLPTKLAQRLASSASVGSLQGAGSGWSSLATDLSSLIDKAQPAAEGLKAKLTPLIDGLRDGLEANTVNDLLSSLEEPIKWALDHGEDILERALEFLQSAIEAMLDIVRSATVSLDWYVHALIDLVAPDGPPDGQSWKVIDLMALVIAVPMAAAKSLDLFPSSPSTKALSSKTLQNLQEARFILSWFVLTIGLVVDIVTVSDAARPVLGFVSLLPLAQEILSWIINLSADLTDEQIAAEVFFLTSGTLVPIMWGAAFVVFLIGLAAPPSEAVILPVTVFINILIGVALLGAGAWATALHLEKTPTVEDGYAFAHLTPGVRTLLGNTLGLEPEARVATDMLTGGIMTYAFWLATTAESSAD